MATTEIDWKDQKFIDAIQKSLADTANCRRLFPQPLNPQPGAVVTSVTVPTMAPGPPLSYGPDQVESTVQVFIDVDVDEQQHAGDMPTVINLIAAGGTALGALEDKTILQGTGGAKPAGRARQAKLPVGSLHKVKGAGSTAIGAAAAHKRPTGTEITRAVSTAMAELENADRPGIYGLILQNELLATLKLAVVAGGGPEINAVEQLIGGNQIAGTSALDRTFTKGEVCGVLFRLSPQAVDLVQTQAPSLKVLGKTKGITNLRVEEDIAIRVLDPEAVHYLEY
jgi:hypothetical protein